MIKSVNDGNNNSLINALQHINGYRIRIDTLEKAFDIGFDADKSKITKKVTGLRAGSNAQKAGLFEGEELGGAMSIYNNDTGKPARIQIVADGKKQWVEFIP